MSHTLRMGIQRAGKSRLSRVVRDELRELVWLLLMIAAISIVSVGLAAGLALSLERNAFWL